MPQRASPRDPPFIGADGDSCNLCTAHWTRYSVPSRPQLARLFQMMNSLTRGFSWVAFTLADQRRDRLCRCRNRSYGVWKPMRPESNDSNETGKRNFEHSLIRFPPTVAKSTNATQPGRSRQRARLGGTTSQAPDTVATALNLLLGEQKVQKATPERVLEAQRLISIGVRLTLLLPYLTDVQFFESTP
jgi:hypothetical protein